jgi:hypothetical protein
MTSSLVNLRKGTEPRISVVARGDMCNHIAMRCSTIDASEHAQPDVVKRVHDLGDSKCSGRASYRASGSMKRVICCVTGSHVQAQLERISDFCNPDSSVVSAWGEHIEK